MKFDHSQQLEGIWIMYLRKSRQDNPDETVEEVLAKHEAMLQEHAERELGHRIPEANIYREVVSGESIDERVEIQKVLSRLEDPNVAGVLVRDASRLSRGDLSDCARIIDNFRFTKTLVGTLMMTYDLNNKMERKFFQDELLRGNDYLEYTKEVLFAGRIAAVKRGYYVNGKPPFGYNRIKLGKGWSLEANDDADTVRLIFDLHVNQGYTPGGVARKLNEMGIPSSKGGEWTRASARNILSNIHYAGKVSYNRVKETIVVQHGERVKRHIQQPEDEVIVAEGKHTGIISMETYQAAQEIIKNAPRVKDKKELTNMFAGVLRCKCGRTMTYHPRHKHGNPRYNCPRRPPCQKMVRANDLEPLIIEALENAELPKLQQKLKNGDGDAAMIQKRRLEKLAKQMAEYRVQEDKQYEFLETGRYTQEVFDRRNATLRKKMDECELEMHKTREAIPKNVDYRAAIIRLEDAIDALKDTDMPIEIKNRKLRAIVKTINCQTTDLGRNNTAINLEIILRL